MNVAISTYEDVLNSAQQLTDDEQARLIEDLQDSAWARDYEARKSSGQLTAEDLDPLPWDQALAEIERERAARRETE